MSDPNKDLGEWLLNKVLKLEEGELLTYQKLEDIGVDTVEIRKIDNQNYEIDFRKIGTFEKFKDGVEKDKLLNPADSSN